MRISSSARLAPLAIACLLAACGSGGGSGDGGPHSDVPVNTGDGSRPQIMGCNIFPADNPWNTDISAYPLDPNSDNYISNMSPTRTLHPDWGDWNAMNSGDYYGIPWHAGSGAAQVAFSWNTSWGDSESDPDPCPSGGGMFCYPIPTNSLIEGGPGASGDDHLLYIDTTGAPDGCTLYEVYATNTFTSSPWVAGNGAIFHLGSDALRPDQWTSADAAGLPILPGLVRIDEVMAGAIHHAMRFTMNHTQNGFIHPATHAAGDSNPNYPPMGLRLRLKASYDLSGVTGPSLVILTAMQHYGLIVADNGSDWYITGDSDDRWVPLIDDISSTFHDVSGSDFEVVQTGPIIPAM